MPSCRPVRHTALVLHFDRRLRDLRARTFDDLPDREQDQFLDICAQAKLVPEDFNVSFTDEIAGDTGVEPRLRSILVQFGSITRAYDGGHEIPWTVQFEEDVKANAFVSASP